MTSGADNGHTVIVGASTGGVHCAEALRMSGHTGRITVVGAEREAPYDRTTLSKGLLRGDVDVDAVALPAAKSFDSLDIELLTNSAAIRLDVVGKRLHLDSGFQTTWTHSIIATGASARRLPGDAIGSKLHNVYTLRSLADAMALKAACPAGSKVVVVGGSYLGLEVAGSLSAGGSKVTVVADVPTLLPQAFGQEVSDWCYRIHQEAGIEIRLSSSVVAIEGEDLAHSVRLASGESIHSDVVVLAVGVTPNTQWLRDSGLLIHNGVVCDESGRTSAQNVYAIGDVANWHNPLFGNRARIEHWTTAIDHGRKVADAILGRESDGTGLVPYFWSEQGGHRIQFAGYLRGDEQRFLVSGDTRSDQFVVGYVRNDVVVGVCAVNSGAAFVRLRSAIAKQSRWPLNGQ